MKYVYSCTLDIPVSCWGGLKTLSDPLDPVSDETMDMITKKLEEDVLSRPCDEIVAVQNRLRNSRHLQDSIIVITKDKAAIL